jgi:hypothetical protein
MNYPTEIHKNGVKYRFVKKYPNFGLYIDENGNKECFQKWDVGIRQVVKVYNFENRLENRY